jgi:membrane protein required for beta-lactamase induction
MYSYTCILLPTVLQSKIYNLMALFYFLVLSLCIACCKVDARSKALLNEQNHVTASDSIVVLSLAC